MGKTSKARSLEKIRQQIDATDHKILRLIKKRANLALEANDAKMKQGQQVRNSQRELLVLENVKREASLQKLPTRSLLIIFQKIISLCRQEQYRVRKQKR